MEFRENYNYEVSLVFRTVQAGIFLCDYWRSVDRILQQLGFSCPPDGEPAGHLRAAEAHESFFLEEQGFCGQPVYSP
jgi:hypothetical protein